MLRILSISLLALFNSLHANPSCVSQDVSSRNFVSDLSSEDDDCCDEEDDEDIIIMDDEDSNEDEGVTS